MKMKQSIFQLSTLLLSLNLMACSGHFINSVIDNQIGEGEAPKKGGSALIKQPLSLPQMGTNNSVQTQVRPQSNSVLAPELPPIPPANNAQIGQSLPPMPIDRPENPGLTQGNTPVPELPSTDQTGSLSVGLLWEKPSFNTQASHQDIAYLQLSVSGSEILKLWKSPISQRLNDPQKRLRLDQLPPGWVDIKLEAFDSQAQSIGVTEVSNVLIRATQTSKVNMQLQLIDTIIEEGESNSGHLAIDVMILDGKTITRKKTVVPQGGYLQFDNQETTCSNTALAPEIPLPTGALPAMSLPLLDLAGSSSALPFVFQDTSELTGSSNQSLACEAPLTKPTQSPSNQVQVLNFKQSDLNLKSGQTLDLTAFLEAQSKQGSLVTSSLNWSSSDSQIARVDSEGKLKALQPGNAQITVEIKGKSAHLSLSIGEQAHERSTPQRMARKPDAKLNLSARRLKPMQVLRLSANQAQGDIYSYYWTISGGTMAAQTFEPQSEMVMFRPGSYEVQLTLIGRDGQKYPIQKETVVVENQS